MADLQNRNQSLADRLKAAQDSLTQTEQRLQAQLTQMTEKFSKDLDALQAANADLTTRLEAHRKDAADWRARYQQEVNAHKADVASLTAQLQAAQERIEKLLAGPGAPERLVPAGKVLEVRTDYAFVLIEGGQDRGVSENDRFVVYTVTPDGKSRKKGVLLVGQVYDHTSLATMAEEEEGQYILEGDPFVSIERWDQFQKRTGSAGS